MKIGVFDSGIGGKSVVLAIERDLPQHQVLYAEDHANLPYGSKPPELLLTLVTPILRKLIDDGCQIIVIACNTVTTTIIDQLRELFSIPIIGIEPMVKPAAERTRSGIIAVCATPTTLKSARYQQLVKDHASNIIILEPDCSDWATMIQENSVNQDRIIGQIKQLCIQGADIIVLGCTHYHWIETEINDVARSFKVRVLQPEKAIVKQLKLTIAQLG